MKVMQNEILLIYNSSDLQDRETKGYAKALDNHQVKEIDLSKDSLTEKQLDGLSDKLGGIENLINPKADTYQNKFKDSDLSKEEWLKVLSQNQELIKSPIALYPDKAEFIESPYQFLQKGMNDNKHGFSYQK